jgi:competence protein ComEC
MKEGIGGILRSKSKLFLVFCFCFIIGASSFSFLENTRFLFYLYISLFCVLFFVVIFWHKPYQRFFCFCLLIFILGAIRFLASIPGKTPGRIEFYNGEKKIVRGFVVREPDIGLSDARYVVRVQNLQDLTVIPTTKEESLSNRSNNRQRSLVGASLARDDSRTQDSKRWSPVSGNIIIKTRIYPEYKYGDNLEVECFLQEPTNFEDSTFNYKKYLAKQGIWSICANSKIKILPGNSGNIVIKIMLQLKNSIKFQMARLWPEPDNSVMAGVLYGSRSGLPQEIVDNFSRTGVSHITAVSGYNVTIMAVALNLVLIYLGFFRRQSFWFLVFLILAFVFFTGASASVVRAGIMGIIVLVSGHIGRLSAIGRVLVYAVVIMLFFNPYLLAWDAGFQLSFLSTLGLVYLSPIIQNVFDKNIKIKNSFIKSMAEVFVTTISAILATLPLIMFQFGRVSIVAPLVNILILWTIPWLMLFGFIALILSFIFFPIGQIIAWLTEFGIWYVIMVINWFGTKGWSAISLRIPLWGMVLIYALLVSIIVRSKIKSLPYEKS